MNYTFFKPLLLSLTLHAVVITAIAYVVIPKNTVPYGNEGIVSVDVIGGSGRPQISSNTRGGPTSARGDIMSSSIEPGSNTGDIGGGQGGSSGDMAGSPNGNPILTKIRMKIERAKYYPLRAKKEGLEGRPEVTFEMNADGTVSSAIIKKPCGNVMLDEAALETVRRAAPFPYYEGAISLAIRYQLEN